MGIDVLSLLLGQVEAVFEFTCGEVYVEVASASARGDNHKGEAPRSGRKTIIENMVPIEWAGVAF